MSLNRRCDMPNLMEVTLISRYYNQEVINRWNYVTSSITASVSLSFALASALGGIRTTGSTTFAPDTVLEFMRAQQSNQVQYRELLVRDVYSNTDFYSTPILTTIVGSQSIGNAMSPVMAYGFRTNRTRTDIRRGTKRFVGVTENDVGAGGVIEAPRLGGLNDLADKMSENAIYDDEGNTITFSPCVVKRELYETPSGKNAYRYYEDPATQFDLLMTGIAWQTYPTVRTQTSRQYGRGS